MLRKTNLLGFCGIFAFMIVLFSACVHEIETTYTVTFNSLGGSEVEQQTVKKGEKAEKPEDPTKTSTESVVYVFSGWYLSEDDGATFSENSFDFTTEINSNVTLYAKWDEIICYTITFNSLGGSEVEQQTVKKGEKVEKPENPTKAGSESVVYVFSGWYLSEDDGVTFSENSFDFATEINSNVTLYAKWKETLSYIVSFNSLGGSEVENQRIESGNKVSKPADPTKVSIETMRYTFAGWYTSSDGGATLSSQLFDFNTAISNNVTLYAKWNEIELITVSFDSKGGSSISSQKIDSGSKATRPENPSKAATENMRYTFSDWYTSSDGGTTLSAQAFDFNLPVSRSITLYAKWNEIQLCTVTFNSDGGSIVESQTLDLGSKASIPTKPSKKIEKTSFAFLGWYDGNNIFNFDNPIISNITLTAHWLEGFVEVEGMTVTEAVQNSLNFKGESKTIIDLFVCDHEVTQKEFREYCRYDGTESGPGTNEFYEPNDIYGLGDDFPVYYVSWYDAIVYCNLRSMEEGLEPVYIIYDVKDPSQWTGIRSSEEDGRTKYCGLKTGDDRPEQSVFDAWKNVIMDETANGYRLPHFKEWEYVARGGKTSIYQQVTYAKSETIDEEAWTEENSYYFNPNTNSRYPRCHEIKEKNPNNLGIYDIVGNLEELCNDWAKDNLASSLGGSDFCELGSYLYNMYGQVINVVSHTACGGSNRASSFWPDPLSCYNSVAGYTRSITTGFRIVRSKF